MFFSKLKKIIWRLSKLGVQVFAVAALSFATAMFVWTLYEPERLLLKSKDPTGYGIMLEKIVYLDWAGAKKLYDRIDGMTTNDVHRMRYQNWMREWKRNPEFKKDMLNRRKVVHRQNSLERKNQKAFDIQKEASKKLPLSFIERRRNWDALSAWKKNLVLREHCVNLLEQENLLQVRSSPNVLLSRSGRNILRRVNKTAEEMCQELVAIGDDEKSVFRSLGGLKGEMNYYHFIRMLKELGIREKEISSYETRLTRLTEDFNSF